MPTTIAEDAAQIPESAFPPPPPVPAALRAPADVAAAPADAEKTASGLASKVLAAGSGSERPALWDSVRVHYTGWTTDGRMFDSSVKRDEPAVFPIEGVIKGWSEGLQLMVVGERRRFWIPAELAYGEKPTRPEAPAGMLVFDVELLEIMKGKAPLPPPADLLAPPKSAKQTKSGLVHRILQKGKGKRRPLDNHTVEVHYTGWTADGTMVDSSVVRGEPAMLPMANDLMPGLKEALRLMVVGERRRLWIPPALAYGDPPRFEGAPAGTLVFDVELLAITESPAEK